MALFKKSYLHCLSIHLGEMWVSFRYSIIHLEKTLTKQMITWSYGHIFELHRFQLNCLSFRSSIYSLHLLKCVSLSVIVISNLKICFISLLCPISMFSILKLVSLNASLHPHLLTN